MEYWSSKWTGKYRHKHREWTVDVDIYIVVLVRQSLCWNKLRKVTQQCSARFYLHISVYYLCLMLYKIHAVWKLIADIQTRGTGNRQIWRHVAAVRRRHAPTTGRACHDVRARDVDVTRRRHRWVGDVCELSSGQDGASGMMRLAGHAAYCRQRAGVCGRWKVVRRWCCSAETINCRTCLFTSSLIAQRHVIRSTYIHLYTIILTFIRSFVRPSNIW